MALGGNFMITLRSPAPSDRERIWAYRAEFLRAGDSLDGTAALDRAESFAEWFSAVEDNRRAESVRSGMVPATSFLAEDAASSLVGMIQLRHCLNDYLLHFGGTSATAYALPSAGRATPRRCCVWCWRRPGRLGLKQVLVTCDAANEASRRTIRTNGGVLDGAIAEGGRLTQRYWIAL